MDVVKLQAFAPNTLKTRRSQWNKYREFCDRLRIPSLPVEPQTVCRFLVDIGDDLSYTTLNNYVSALNVLGKMYESDFDLRQDYGVLLLLKGFKRIKGETDSPKDPLLPEDLRKIFPVVDLHDVAQYTIWIIIVLAFRTLLRKSHFVSANDDDHSHLLRVGDILFEPWGCRVTINSSKTIQFGERALHLPVSWSAPPLCAATLLREYLGRFPKPTSEFLFTLPHKGLMRPVQYNLALNYLKTWCKDVNIHKDIGFHSLRRGAASYMHRLKIELVSIQRAGDWKSLCVLKYLSVDFDQKREVESRVSSSL